MYRDQGSRNTIRGAPQYCHHQNRQTNKQLQNFCPQKHGAWIRRMLVLSLRVVIVDVVCTYHHRTADDVGCDLKTPDKSQDSVSRQDFLGFGFHMVGRLIPPVVLWIRLRHLDVYVQISVEIRKYLYFSNDIGQHFLCPHPPRSAIF